MTDGEEERGEKEHERAHLGGVWLNAFQTGPIEQAVISVYLKVYLQKGDDERSQGKVGGFLQLGVEFFNGEGGILEQRENT